jgi:hypothetical protein
VSLDIIIFGGAFLVSVTVSYLTARVWPGVVIPLCGLVTYLFLASIKATGGKYEGLTLPMVYGLSLMIYMGVPAAVISVLGARLGVFLRDRGFRKKKYYDDIE